MRRTLHLRHPPGNALRDTPCYTSRMARKITLEDKIDAFTSIVEKGFASMENGFAAVADDIADIREKMATKDQILSLQTQVNSIEQQLRETRIEVRLGSLEEKVFGAPRR